MKKIVTYAFLTLMTTVLPLNAKEVRKLVRALNLPGKFESGQCLPFAKALHARLRLERVESRIVTYSWAVLTPDQGLLEGKHAFVAFRDEQGHWWGLDNLRWLPVRLDPKQMALSFDWNAAP